jgi:Gpi18-like mannosyltransferase
MSKFRVYFNRFQQSPLPFILIIFIVSRIILLITAWFAGYYLPNPSYQQYVDQGWFMSPYSFIDIWSRWDSRWYMDIIMHGYVVTEDIQSTYSTVAFFPLFPLLVKLFSFLLPGAINSPTILTIIGLILNNLLFITSLYFIYQLMDQFFQNQAWNKAVIVLIMAYPGSFYFSCFYTESLFLFLAVMSVWFAKKENWLLSAISCGLLAVTRPQGILMAIPISILLLQSMQWKIKNFPRKALWLLLIPIPLFIFLFYMRFVTGDFLAPITAQAAWGKETGNFKLNFIDWLFTPQPDVFKIDALMTYLFIGLSIYALFKLPSVAYGLFALFVLIVPVVSGTSVSMTRYIAVAFPAFMAAIRFLKKELAIYSLAALFFAIQIFYFIGWVNYYWIA